MKQISDIVQNTKLTQGQFLERSNAIHGDKYDYSKSVYTRATNKLTIICPDHGEFEQTGKLHMNGSGCPKCGKLLKAQKAQALRSNTSTFIKLALAKHDGKYSYEKTEYTNALNKLTITCPTHGDFEQQASSHLHCGAGCPKCAKVSMAELLSSDTLEFIKRANAKHAGKYSYEKTEYTKALNKLTITCPTHGDFEQQANSHLLGKGCPRCGQVVAGKSNRLRPQVFEQMANEKHAGKYSYEKTEYTKSQDKIIITCPTHGDFEQQANSHLMGTGCPRCVSAITKPHQVILDFLAEVLPGTEVRINDRKAINPKELDIYLPDHKLAIEINGVYWHSIKSETEWSSIGNRTKHFDKFKACEQNGISLLQFTDTEINTKPELVCSIVANKLGLTNKRVFARKTEVVELNKHEAIEFINANHLRGTNRQISGFGLVDNKTSELVMVMTLFGNEIDRMCTKLGTSVVGGASKLLAKFEQKLKDAGKTEIVSYSYNELGANKAYPALGFSKVYDDNMRYYWSEDGKSLDHRVFYQKHKLLKRFPEYAGKACTEKSICFDKGFVMYYSAGDTKWIKQIS